MTGRYSYDCPSTHPLLMRSFLVLVAGFALFGCSSTQSNGPTASTAPVALPAGFDSFREVQYCALDGTTLRNYDARYDAEAGIFYTPEGRLVRTGGSFEPWVTERGRYAASQPWYIDNEPIDVRGREYVKYGLPRVLGVTEISFYEEAGGAAAFVEAGASGTPEILYVAVRPDCEFQPYQLTE